MDCNLTNRTTIESFILSALLSSSDSFRFCFRNNHFVMWSVFPRCNTLASNSMGRRKELERRGTSSIFQRLGCSLSAKRYRLRLFPCFRFLQGTVIDLPLCCSPSPGALPIQTALLSPAQASRSGRFWGFESHVCRLRIHNHFCSHAVKEDCPGAKRVTVTPP